MGYFKNVDNVFESFVEKWDGIPFSNVIMSRRRCAFRDNRFRFFFGFVNRMEGIPLKVEVEFGVEDVEIAEKISEAKGHPYSPMRYYLHSSVVVNFWRKEKRSERCTITGWEFRTEKDWEANIKEMVAAGKHAHQSLLEEVKNPNFIRENNYFEVDELSADKHRICGYSRDVDYTLFFDLLQRREFDEMEGILSQICRPEYPGWSELCKFFRGKIESIKADRR